MALATRLTRGQFTLPAIVFGIGAALSVVLGLADRHEIDRAAHQRFEAMATEATRKVEDRFDAYTEVLIGMRALFNSAERVNAEQFRNYVAGLRLETNYPGFQTLNYVAYTPPADPDSADPQRRLPHHTMVLIEPLAGNQNYLGKDLAAIPPALKALEQARDSGALTSSGLKIQIKGRPSDIGLAIRLPVYRAGMPQDTPEQRRAAYVGSVGAGFRVAEVMRDLTREMTQGLSAGARLRLFDGGQGPAPSNDKPLFDSAAGGAPAPAAGSFDRAVSFELGGHRWTVEVSQDERSFVGGLDRSMPWVIFLCGLAISTLLAGIVYSLTTSRRRAEGIARAMTLDLRTSERRLDEAQHLASLGSWIVDVQTSILHCSDEALRIFGFTAEAPPRDLWALLSRVPLDERADVERQIAHATGTHERVEFEHRLTLPEGTERWVHVIVQWGAEGGPSTLRGTVRDVTQQRKVAQRLKLEHEIAGVLLTDGDPEAVISRALEAVCAHLGWDCAAFWVVGDGGMAHCSGAWHIADDATLEQFAWISRSLSYRHDEGSLGRAWAEGESLVINTASHGDQFTRDALAGQAGLSAGLIVPMRAVGRTTAIELFSRCARAGDEETVESLRAIALQISQYDQRKEAEQRLRYVASHDALTGLSNRSTLQRDMARAIKRSQRHHKRFAVMFVDLDHFKRINDTLGHGAGDAMIKACGERLTALLRDDDAVARFGGDEFVLIVENLSKPTDAAVIADRVLGCFAEPFVIGDRELHVTASVGVSVFPEDGTDGETLLKNADTAMYRAKDKGRGAYQFYTSQMNEQGSERLMLEAGLRRAVERGELDLHYQPKMDIRTRRIVGVEALMRWRHPVLGPVSPVQFIPIAEETGLIVEMGKWALDQACADARDWQQRGLPAVQMSVNLSPRQLNSPTLITDIDAALNSSGLSPALLELEITEGAVMKNPEQAAVLLQEIRAMGVGLAIDDFGTGYSSLSYLKRFPLTAVKIDRSFVNDLSHDTDAQALTDGIVTLAHGLRMKVVAEGVETAEQLAYLAAHGCDEIQGYWLCKPVPAEEACKFMARHLRNQFAAPAAA
jgi:diguanylate cyclase (GGDEF)-like protein/PAS domain S-box-containing protein